MGLQVGVLNSVSNGGSSVTYRPIGTNISCGAKSLDDGRFALDWTFDESSVLPDKSPAQIPGLVSFQSVTVHNNLTLADGQTMQFIAAADPTTGEVSKIDISIAVVK